MTKWFMSYVKVYLDGRFMFGSCVVSDREHPIVKVKRWNTEYGDKKGFTDVLLSFQQVPDDTPAIDVESFGIS